MRGILINLAIHFMLRSSLLLAPLCASFCTKTTSAAATASRVISNKGECKKEGKERIYNDLIG
jgi:hypothetical protein